MGSKKRPKQPFPLHRPPITVRPGKFKPFTVDCQELRWWFIVPKAGGHALWAIYDPPDWHLTSVTDLAVTGAAEIHGQRGVEIEVADWIPGEGWIRGGHRVYGALTRNSARWLATLRSERDQTRLATFLDEGFDRDWGAGPRHLADRGRFVPAGEGSFTLCRTGPCRNRGAMGAGVFNLTIGRRRFSCLRVIEVPDRPADTDILIEAFLTRQGHSILVRRYNGRQYGRSEAHSAAAFRTWDERFPDHAVLVIDGVAFVHWYDCLSERSLPRSS